MEQQKAKIKAIYPQNQISADQDRWNQTAEGVLRNLLWQIETGQVKPKELAVCFIDYKGGEKRYTLQHTRQDPERIIGILEICKDLHFRDRIG